VTMAAGRSQSVLQLHLPEGWPGPATNDALFRYARYRHGKRARGVARLSEVPKATTTIAVAPASAALFVRVALPTARGVKVSQLLTNAVEDAIAMAPEDVHAVLVEHVPGGTSLVAVVTKTWLSAALAELAAHGFRPTRFLIETELAALRVAAEETHPWLVVCSRTGGFVAFGNGEIVALDLTDGPGTLPLALRLARDERLRRGDDPHEILVFTSPGSERPDFQAWSRALRVPVRNGGEWLPDRIDGRALDATDLLRGDFTSTLGAHDVSGTLRLAAIAVAVVLGTHAVLTFGDWWRLSSEEGRLKARMEAQFRQLFPDAKSIVDAPLQLQRSVATLQRGSGVSAPSDFIPLLAAVAPPLVAAGASVERIHYERGDLELEVKLAAGKGREALEKQLVVPGYHVKVERLGSGKTGNTAVLRVGAGA
jgi:general secretion pathway protein L